MAGRDMKSFWGTIIVAGALAVTMLFPAACASQKSDSLESSGQSTEDPRELERRAQYRATIEIWSGIAGVVLLDGEELGLVASNTAITVTLDHAAGTHTVAVNDSFGNVVQAIAPLQISKTGMINSEQYVTYYVFILDPRPLAANDPEDFDVIYNAEGVTITGYTGTRKQVVIPETMYNQKVTIIGEKSFSDTNIVSIVIPNTVKTIGDNAFDKDHLLRVNLPANMNDNSMNAFPAILAHAYKNHGKKGGSYVKRPRAWRGE